MYKITYKNGYVRYSIYQYGGYRVKNPPQDILKSEYINKDEVIKCGKIQKKEHIQGVDNEQNK